MSTCNILHTDMHVTTIDMQDSIPRFTCQHVFLLSFHMPASHARNAHLSAHMPMNANKLSSPSSSFPVTDRPARAPLQLLVRTRSTPGLGRCRRQAIAACLQRLVSLSHPPAPPAAGHRDPGGPGSLLLYGQRRRFL